MSINSINQLDTHITKIAQDAAIACYNFIGRGDNNAADKAAVDAMRNSLNQLNISGKIIIGEGERDEAPMLYIGEEVGKGGIKIDIALDPLEGTTICANMDANSLAVIAFGQENSFLHAPDVYMEKIVIGPNLPDQLVDLDNNIKTNLSNLAKAKKCNISDLSVMILERDRHKELIAKTLETGARVKLFGDGDIAASINTCQEQTGIDMYIGTGGAPEGVLTAAALKTCGGQIMGRLIFDNNQRQIDRAKKMGITDLNKKYTINDMAKGDVLFAATGVTDGNLVKGIKINHNQIITETLLMNSGNKTIQKITTNFLK